MSQTHKSWSEELKVNSESLIAEVEKLIHEGNVNHIKIKNPDGHVYVEFPVTVGIIGLVAAPFVAAVGAIATYAAHFTIEVSRSEPPTQS